MVESSRAVVRSLTSTIDKLQAPIQGDTFILNPRPGSPRERPYRTADQPIRPPTVSSSEAIGALKQCPYGTDEVLGQHNRRLDSRVNVTERDTLPHR
jgi:hypothetical protein